MSPNQTPKPIRNVILVAIDMSADAKGVLAAAIDLARRTLGAELHLVHAIAPHTFAQEGSNAAGAREAVISMHAEFLDSRAKEAQTESGVTVVGHLREGDAERAILQSAANVDADTIVVGTHGRRGLARWRMGSVAEGVVRNAPCPVWVVREKEHHAPHLAEIEPPCPDCVAAQRATRGATLWCARHSEHHPRAHVHYATPQGFGAGSSLLQP